MQLTDTLKRSVSALFDDDKAVSPVIGVILMVAITVILAAVIASFVLGLGPSGETAPTASFTGQYNSDGSNLTISHDTGEKIKQTNLYIRGEGVSGSWKDLEGSTSDKIDGVSAVASGNSVTVGDGGHDGADANSIPAEYTIDVVWESGETSSTLSTLEGA